MDQGIYIVKEGKIVQTDLPINIPAGATSQVYLRTGLIMDSNVYKLLRDQFNPLSTISMKDLEDFLRHNGTDFYGNKVESPVSGIFQYPTLDKIKEQKLNILKHRVGARLSKSCLGTLSVVSLAALESDRKEHESS
jgi:hypothetical protein